MEHGSRVMVPPRLAAGFALVLCVSLTPAASAQQPAPQAQPAGDAALVEARRLYDEGRAHFDAGRFVEALASFERAYLLRSNPVVLVPVLECQERLDRVVDAISTVERYLRERPTAPDRARMEQRLQVLRARPSRVRVVSDPPGARVVLDGRELPQTTPAAIEVPPGRHRIALSVNGQRGAEREVDALPGGTQELNLGATDATQATSTSPTPAPTPTPPAPATTTVVAQAQTPAPEPTPPVLPPPALPQRRGPSPAVWVAASTGGVGLIMGTVFGLMALSDASAYDQTPTREVYDRGRTNSLVSDIGFGVAILSAAVGVIVYFADRGGSAERPRSSLRLSPSPRLSATPGGLVVNF